MIRPLYLNVNILYMNSEYLTSVLTCDKYCRILAAREIAPMSPMFLVYKPGNRLKRIDLLISVRLIP